MTFDDRLDRLKAFVEAVPPHKQAAWGCGIWEQPETKLAAEDFAALIDDVEDLLECVQMAREMFACVGPTRDGESRPCPWCGTCDGSGDCEYDEFMTRTEHWRDDDGI